MKFPIGIQTFSNIIEDGYVYVDKTDLVYKLVTEGKIYFLSRPRRFGKSLLISTLESYFLGKKELFKGLKIDALEKEWNTYPVFHLDFNAIDFTEPDALKKSLEIFVATAEDTYGRIPYDGSLGERFEYVLSQAHEKTGRRAVVLIDEYDKPLLDVMETKLNSPDGTTSLEEYNRNILKGFYSVFKAADRHLQFVLLTGVTKFSQVSVFSGFNQPKDLGRDPRYDALCGITTEELLTYFDEPIRQMADKKKVSREKMIATLKRRYDGYHFSEEMTDVYNPYSLINCFDSLRLDDYWFSSGTPSYLMRLMASNDVNINEIIKEEYPVSEFLDFKADKQMPLPMLYQSGYLTIKAFNARRSTYRLGFPNEEVQNGLIAMLTSNYFNSGATQTSWLNRVSDALETADLEMFGKLFTSFLADVSYRFHDKKDDRASEKHFQYTFFLLTRMIATYNIVVEKETSDGRIDCVVECPDYIYVMEFKRDGSAEQALKQIDDKGYTKPYLADPRPLYKVGINFSSTTGTIEEMLWEQER